MGFSTTLTILFPRKPSIIYLEALKTLAFNHLDYCQSFLSGLSASIILPPVARVIFLKPQI